jgi:LCP family protein required for cell wall assembly
MRRNKEPGDAGGAGPKSRPGHEPGRRRALSWAKLRALFPPRRPRVRIVLRSLAVVLALVLAGGSLTIYLKYREAWDSIGRIDVQADLSGNRPPLDPNALNILLIGSDSRSGVNGSLGGNAGIAGARSDTIMILHIAPGAHQAVVLSIPRDSVVPILNCAPEAGTPGQTAQPASEVEQVNTSFADGGPGCLWETVEQTTGIRINDFVELTFIGFVKIIDALGGVNVCLPAAVDDPVSGLDLSAGRHRVYGKEALAFWRTREGVGEGDDPQRIQRDQFLMASLLQGLEHSGLLSSPAKMLAVINAVDGHGYLTTDTQLTTDRMLQLAEAIHGISADSVQFVTVPWGAFVGDAQWIDATQEPSGGNPNWVQWVQPDANNLFLAIAHNDKLPKTSKNRTKTTVKPADVQVRVFNGTTTAGLAATTATSLSARGFKVVGPASDAATASFTTSVIQYSTPVQLPEAEELAKVIGNAKLQQDGALKNGVLHLILGSTFTALRPASSTPAAGSTITDLAGTYGGITGSVNICDDSNAFSGPDGD